MNRWGNSCILNLVIEKTQNCTYVSYYKLVFIKKNIKHCKYYCKNTNIKIAFSPNKVIDLCSAKESGP